MYISKIMKQNNFINLNLQNINQKLSWVENRGQNLVKDKEEEIIYSKQVKLEPVNFKPPIEVPKFNLVDNRKHS